MLGNSSLDHRLVTQYTHWYTFGIGHDSTSDLIQYYSPPHSIRTIKFMNFIPLSTKASSTGTPTVEISATNITGSYAPYVIHYLPWFTGPHTNLTGGRFTTVISFSESILFFVIITTGGWYAFSFTNTECASKENSIHDFYKYFFFRYYMKFCITTTCHFSISDSGLLILYSIDKISKYIPWTVPRKSFSLFLYTHFSEFQIQNHICEPDRF